MNTLEKLENTLYADDGLISLANNNKVLSDAKLDDLYLLLEGYRRDWKGLEAIPRQEAAYISEIVPWLYEYLYSEVGSNPAIFEKIQALTVAISHCFYSHPDNINNDLPLKQVY
jgi:hypothetical protein